jgi:glycosyltransferase involved in cell wall biosynthesis
MGGRILVVTYFFPPSGGSSAQRNLGLVRRLPELGYEPVMVTAPSEAEEHWAPVDQSLMDELPAGAEVVRVSGRPPAEPGPLTRRLERVLDRDDGWRRWWIQAALEAARGAVDGCELIYAPLEPYETAVVAEALSRERGIPWVADLLDPWALDEMRIHLSGIHRRRDLARMRRLLATADAVIMNTPEAERRARDAFPELDGRIVESIPVGFEPADFEGPVAPRRDGRFRIAHTGYLHTEDGLRHRRTARMRRLLGGVYMDVDPLTRSHVHLLAALDRLLGEDPSLADTIEVHLAGALTPTDHAIAERSPVARARGYLSHVESLELIRTADLLFLPLHDLPSGGRTGLIPAKTYEYLASGTPILAAVPAGDTQDILREAGTAHVVAPSDEAAMARALRGALERWRAGEPAAAPRAELLARCERGEVARRLAGVFDDVLARRSALVAARS